MGAADAGVGTAGRRGLASLLALPALGIDGGVTLLVTLEDGALFVEHAREGRFPIFAESETEFFLRAANVQITFTRDESGAVDGLVLHQGGRDSLATRVR